MSKELIRRVLCCKDGCDKFYVLQWDKHVPDEWAVLSVGESEYPICKECCAFILGDTQ